MSPEIPSPFELALLALAAYRLFRLISEDTILDRPRRWVLRLGNWQEGTPAPHSYRAWLGQLLECAWCLGAWISVGWWVAWQAWPSWTLFAAVPFAISALVGTVASLLALSDKHNG